MFHDIELSKLSAQNLAAMGTNAVAYVKQMKTEEIIEAFPNTPNLEIGQKYWALFGADGSLLMLASRQSDITSSAFLNDLKPILPN